MAGATVLRFHVVDYDATTKHLHPPAVVEAEPGPGTTWGSASDRFAGVSDRTLLTEPDLDQPR